MLTRTKVDITTNDSGDATVYIAPGTNTKFNGLLWMLKYTPGTIATGADIVITGETTGLPIMTISNAGTSVVYWYPRALLNEVADGSAGTSGTEVIPIVNERIKVVVAQGGNVGVGSIEATLLTDSAY